MATATNVGAGTAIGGAAGSVIPGVGTAIGAGVGAGVGLLVDPVSNMFSGPGPVDAAKQGLLDKVKQAYELTVAQKGVEEANRIFGEMNGKYGNFLFTPSTASGGAAPAIQGVPGAPSGIGRYPLTGDPGYFYNTAQRYQLGRDQASAQQSAFAQALAKRGGTATLPVSMPAPLRQNTWDALRTAQENPSAPLAPPVQPVQPRGDWSLQPILDAVNAAQADRARVGEKAKAAGFADGGAVPAGTGGFNVQNTPEQQAQAAMDAARQAAAAGQAAAPADVNAANPGPGIDYSQANSALGAAGQVAGQLAQQGGANAGVSQTLQGMNGPDYGAANATLGQGQGLIGDVMARANGQTPSLAQALLKQQTDRNMQQAAGQLASAKGLNPGIVARAANQNAVNANQQAGAAGAALRAQEQTAAQGLAGQLIGQQAGLQGTLATQANQARLNALGLAGQLNTADQAARIGALGAAGQLALGAGGQYSQNASTDAANQLNYNKLAGDIMLGQGQQDIQQQQLSLNALQGNNQINAQQQATLNQVQALLAGGDRDRALALLGGLLNGAGSAAAMYGMNAGQGNSGGYSGGSTYLDSSMAGSPNYTPAGSPVNSPWPGADPIIGPGTVDMGGQGVLMARGGEVPMVAGGQVPGTPRHPGVDVESNDTVKALLTPDEIVLPLSVTQAPDAAQRAAEFVAAIKAREKAKAPTGYGAVLAGQRAIAERLARLEYALGGRVC